MLQAVSVAVSKEPHTLREAIAEAFDVAFLLDCFAAPLEATTITLPRLFPALPWCAAFQIDS